MNSQEQKRLLMDLDVNMRTVDCFYTVTFYGALFREVRKHGQPPHWPSQLAGSPGAWGYPRECCTQPSQKAILDGAWGWGTVCCR